MLGLEVGQQQLLERNMQRQEMFSIFSKTYDRVYSYKKPPWRKKGGRLVVSYIHQITSGVVAFAIKVNVLVKQTTTMFPKVYFKRGATPCAQSTDDCVEYEFIANQIFDSFCLSTQCSKLGYGSSARAAHSSQQEWQQ